MININDLPDPIINYDFEKVYAPSDDTYLIIDYFKKHIDYDNFDGINIKEIKRVLDIGTGSGIIAIFFQIIKTYNPNFNPEIYASDILEEAIKCAKLNERENNFEGEIKFIKSNLFKSFPVNLKKSFNIVVFNPPYLPSSKLIEMRETKLNVDFSWDGGLKGYNLFLDFLDGVKEFLNIEKKNYIYFLSSSRTDLFELNKSIIKKGFNIKVLVKKHIFFEDIILNRLELSKI